MSDEAAGGTGPIAVDPGAANGHAPSGGIDGAGIDGAGIDGAGIDGAGIDGAGIDGAGIDGAGIDGAGIDGAGIDGAGIDGAGIDGAGIDGAGIGGGTAEEDRIARGTGVREQIERGAEVREQNRQSARRGAPEPYPEEPGPSRPEQSRPEQSRPEQSRPEQSRPEQSRPEQSRPEQSRVPSWLQTGAAWSWRLLLLAAAVYLITRLFGVLYVVVVPCTAALLLTALLQPLTARLRQAGLPGLAATWCTLLVALAVIGGLGVLVGNRVSADYPALISESRHTITQVESWLAGPPFHVKSSSVKKILNDIPGYLAKHKSFVEGAAVTGGKIAAELLGGLVLMLFVTFFLLKDGERIWNWLIGAMRIQTARRVDRAGHAAWLAVVYYMRGTVAVAAIHAVVIGIVLGIMGAPLVIPLAVLVFLAAFVPLVGLLVAGALAIVVTLAAKGWPDAVILLVILIIEDQLEGHLFQPQVVGRVIRLHPLAVILSLAVGTVLAGIPGAVVAVPIVAVITRALPELRRDDVGPDDP